MTIFGTGIYCGVQAQHGVLSFERDVLGMDVTVPPEAGEDGKEGETPANENGEDAAKPADGGGPAKPEPGPSPQPTPMPTPAPDVAPTPIPAPTPSPEAAPTSAPTRFPVAIPEPVDDEQLARRLASLRKLEVKVFVDPDLVAERADWIVYATQLVSAASGSYKNMFGIELKLIGVVEWDAATAALGRNPMLEDLRSRPAEGADLVIGLTAQSVDGDRGTPRPAADAHNEAFALVYADSRGAASHLRPLLRELGHLFGAPDVTDAQSDAYQRGSWMSQAPVPEGSTPWVDPESRRRILERKDLPLAETK
jgi:hypothetical protein